MSDRPLPDLDALESGYAALKAKRLDLDLTRGKPSPEQLDLSNAMLELPGVEHYRDQAGTDCRNYGGLDGLPEMKQVFADILGVEAANVIVGGASSLTLMHDALVRACLFGVPGGEGPWSARPERKFLCPVPGYDRHFAITEHLGFELISVPMGDDGPDMDAVVAAAADPQVLGIWCVPKYSNPTGACYSDAVVERLASMQTGAADFRIMWDNAYAEHHLTDQAIEVADILGLCTAHGHPERVLEFASTSKMTFPGAGVSALAASPANITDARHHIGCQSIGPDKLNQLRHCRFLPDIEALRAHMREQARLIRPRFERVDEVLEDTLGPYGIATWTRPQGGYFISLDIRPGLAAEVVALARDAGVALTAAGAPFPYGRDPDDRNIRIAPTFASLEDVEMATRVLASCVLLASARAG